MSNSSGVETMQEVQEKQSKNNQDSLFIEEENISYNDDIHLVSLDELAEEKRKNSSFYYELLSFIKTVKIGVDLTKIAAPIFVMRPISFLELFSEYAQPSKTFLK
jgi:hypothetical protein